MAITLQAYIGVGGHGHIIKAKRPRFDEALGHAAVRTGSPCSSCLSDTYEDIAIKVLPVGDSHTPNELFAVSVVQLLPLSLVFALALTAAA